MTKQEYQHFRNLAWDILIDTKSSELPVNIRNVALFYSLKNYFNNSESPFYNAVIISKKILGMYGYNDDPENAKHLAIRIMSPMIVLKELKINSTEEISRLTGLPHEISVHRFEQYLMLLQRNKFETSHMETKVLNQFMPWIKENST